MDYKEEKKNGAKIDILNIAELLKEILTQKKALTTREKTLKEELRGLMKEYEIPKISNERVSISISTPILVDPHELRTQSQEDYDKYSWVKKTVMINKKGLKEEKPELYKLCIVEGTPRITVK